VGESGYESRSENCCFAGHELHGKVLLTVAAGGVAFRERSFALSEVPDTAHAAAGSGSRPRGVVG
jgi:hypothetical protein